MNVNRDKVRLVVEMILTANNFYMGGWGDDLFSLLKDIGLDFSLRDDVLIIENPDDLTYDVMAHNLINAITEESK